MLAGEIEMLKVPEAVAPVESVTLALKVNSPAVSGVPPRAPDAESVRPPGSPDAVYV